MTSTTRNKRHLNLYISPEDRPVVEELKRELRKERKSLSIFLLEAAVQYLRKKK